MKEFCSQVGGRFTYVDDLINLQELALAFTAIFDGCDNFIVSGCEVVNNTITPGIVFLNGKLRVCKGAGDIALWPQFIYEVNTTESVPYQYGGEKIGRNIWGCAIGPTVPAVSVGGISTYPQSIMVKSNGGVRMKDIWLGKYTVLLESSAKSQKIQGSLSADSLSAPQIAATNRLSLKTSMGNIQMYYEGANMIMESLVNNGADKYRFVASNDVSGFQLYKNSVLIAEFTESQIRFSKPVTSPQANFGSIQIGSTQIFNSTTATNDGEISINLSGLNAGNDYYRNTHIGNGKGSKLLSVIGQSAQIHMYGGLTLNSSAEAAVTLMSNKSKEDLTLKKLFLWQDSSKATMAQLGFADSGSQLFSVSSFLSSIKIQGLEFVDMAPAIKENGVLLTEKYVQQTTFKTELSKKPDTSQVYTCEDADKTFAKQSGGLRQFINADKTKSQLCEEIGAVTAEDLKEYPTLSNCLSDMATTEDLKKKIRDNIGAASAGDYQAKMSDTGWVHIVDSLYARQIGNIVSIQGNMTAVHAGIAFRLPNRIDSPRYTVAYDAPMNDSAYFWGCVISGGDRTCRVARCNHHGVSIPISITYMI